MTPSQITPTARGSVGLPAERVAQIRALAEARGITSTAIIEEWINRAIAEGAPGAIELPGFMAMRDDDSVFIQIAGRDLPWMKVQKAILLATVLDGAADTPNPVHEFNLPTGRAIPVDLDQATLTIGRHSRAVIFFLTDKETGKVEKFATPASFITDMARIIRAEIDAQ